jgi:hypothetical protein
MTTPRRASRRGNGPIAASQVTAAADSYRLSPHVCSDLCEEPLELCTWAPPAHPNHDAQESIFHWALDQLYQDILAYEKQKYMGKGPTESALQQALRKEQQRNSNLVVQIKAAQSREQFAQNRCKAMAGHEGYMRGLYFKDRTLLEAEIANLKEENADLRARLETLSRTAMSHRSPDSSEFPPMDSDSWTIAPSTIAPSD